MIAFQDDEPGGGQSLQLFSDLLRRLRLRRLIIDGLTLRFGLRQRCFLCRIGQQRLNQGPGCGDIRCAFLQRIEQSAGVEQRIDLAKILEIQGQLALPVALGQFGLTIDQKFRFARQQGFNQRHQFAERLGILVGIARHLLLPLL